MPRIGPRKLKRIFLTIFALYLFVLILNVKDDSIDMGSETFELSAENGLKLNNPSSLHSRHIQSNKFTDQNLESKKEEYVSHGNKERNLNSSKFLGKKISNLENLNKEKNMIFKDIKKRDKNPRKSDSHLRRKEINTLKFKSHLNNNKTEVNNARKKDWHDYKAIEEALQRTGLGELGQPAFIEEKTQEVISEVKKSIEKYGMNGYLSEKISVNRSVPDHRPGECKTRKYEAKLPKVSVIMPFFNECFSTLVRTCHSIINRTPPELLEEIFLVNDNSTFDDLGAKLENYVNKYLPKVKIIKLPERYGIMRARLAGAKQAKSEIIVFLDSHIEVGYNWLPPLIEPIVLNNRTCTCPYIDTIQSETFRYFPTDGWRGGFDWELYYKRLPLLTAEDYTIPRPNPIMAGGLFAIRADFFWELGGYDSGLEVWGGEQYELSFKIWMCGGTILDVPCSRVAHIYKEGGGSRGFPRHKVLMNFMRVVDVWMDDYKKYFYRNLPEEYKNLTVGDMSDRKALREKLQCKSFKWFLENVAFDTVNRFTFMDPFAFAKGGIKSLAYPTNCLTMQHNLVLEVTECIGTLIEPYRTQNWIFSKNGEIRMKGDTMCLETKPKKKYVDIMKCHGLKGNQDWVFDFESKWIINVATERCLDSFPNRKVVFLSKCDEQKISLKWEFGFYNRTIFSEVVTR